MATLTEYHAIVVGRGVGVTELMDVMKRQLLSRFFFVTKPANIAIVIKKLLLNMTPVAFADNFFVGSECLVLVTSLNLPELNLPILSHTTTSKRTVGRAALNRAS